jgi:hypothetical protein
MRVNILDFGAVGDGIQDDTTAFEAAMRSKFELICVPVGMWTVHVDIDEKRFVSCKGRRCSCRRKRKLRRRS